MLKCYFVLVILGGILVTVRLNINILFIIMREQINKYFEGLLSNSEKEELFIKLNSDEKLKEEFVELQNTWAVSGVIDHINDVKWKEDKYKELQQLIRKREKRSYYISFVKYAVTAVFLISFVIGLERFTSNKVDEEFIFIESPKGQRTHIILADNTEVWLNSRSRMKVSNKFNIKNRLVELDGEGLFNVSEDKNKPFIIKTKQYNVEVTGTKFNVFAYSSSSIFETDLIEGSVLIYNEEDNSNALRLLPDEKGFSMRDTLHKTTYVFSETQYYKDGIYSFENKSLEYLTKRLELWYNIKINISESTVAEYVFSGKFRQDDDLIKIFDAIKETGKFNYIIKEVGEIEIY